MAICFLLAGNRKVSSINEMEQPLGALLSFLRLHFLLDFDHLNQYKADLAVLYYFILANRSIPRDMLESLLKRVCWDMLKTIICSRLVDQEICLLSC